jgi:hypothetical protein
MAEAELTARSPPPWQELIDSCDTMTAWGVDRVSGGQVVVLARVDDDATCMDRREKR